VFLTTVFLESCRGGVKTVFGAAFCEVEEFKELGKF
jgi:hypothetical protein